MKCTDTFRTPPYRHNCAQAVAYKYAKLYGLEPDEALERFAGCAAGRAPGGLCGALHAAQCALPDKAGLIEDEFKKATNGHVTCTDIKTKSGTPCPVCVMTIDCILEKLTGE